MTRRALVTLAAALGLAALALSSDSVRADRPANLLEIATGFSARQACTCAFVIGQSDDYCQEFGQIPGETIAITVAIDRDAQTVTSSIGSLNRTSRAVAGVGCTLDPLP